MSGINSPLQVSIFILEDPVGIKSDFRDFWEETPDNPEGKAAL
jgi:hypothetical protein